MKQFLEDAAIQAEAPLKGLRLPSGQRFNPFPAKWLSNDPGDAYGMP
jgi:hypothetical protein